MVAFDLSNDEVLMTITMARECLVKAWFLPRHSIGIVVPDHKFTVDIFRMLTDEYISVPDWMRPQMSRRGVTTGCIVFDNGSVIKLLDTLHATKGLKFDLMFAHQDVDPDWVIAFRPTLPSGNLIKYFK